jgi:hypothetical protein
VAAATSLNGQDENRQRARSTLSRAEADLQRLMQVVTAGADPRATAAAINDAQARKDQAIKELAEIGRDRPHLTEARVREQLASFEGIPDLLASAKPEDRKALYLALGVLLTYDPDQRTVDGEIDTGDWWGYVRVGGGT